MDAQEILEPHWSKELRRTFNPTPREAVTKGYNFNGRISKPAFFNKRLIRIKQN